jgi:hypothetical protein
MAMAALELGIVVATYPEGNSLDVLMMRTGARLANVQVLSHDASSNHGTANLPTIGLPIDDTRWNFVGDPTRVVRAVMCNIGGMPFCLGFVYPQVGQMQFTAPDQKIVRHSSDFYELTQANGDHEMYHPSGSYFKIGSTNTHTDLTGQDVDQQWKIAKNTGAAVYAHLTVANAGNVVATIDVDPSGNIAITNNGTTTVTTTGNVSVSTQGNASVSAQGNATVSAQGNTNITASETVNIQGGSGVSITTTSGTPTNITSTGPINLSAPSINLN